MIGPYVHALLRDWAEWRLKRDDGGLGYPQKAAFLSIGGGTSSYNEINAYAYDVDAAVSTLLPEYKQAIIQHYTMPGTKEQKAKRCNCSIRTYDARLEFGSKSVLEVFQSIRSNKK